MLDYFKKIIGSSLIKNVDIEKNNFGLGGFDKQWEMFKGTKTDNKKDVCVFIFDKKNASPQLIEFLKKEPNSLQKYRHPQILQIVEPLVEDKKGMGYVTESFQCTLQQRMEQNQEICESMLELKLHLLSLFQVLNFLHYTSKSAHLNLSPENIYIMPDGQWKLGGMQFTTQILDSEIAVNNYNVNNKQIPNLNYTAPEVQHKGKGMFQSDIFSLGMLLLQIQKHVFDKGNYDPFFTIKDSESYKSQIQSMGKRLQTEQFYNSAEEGLKEVLKKLLQYKPDGRPQVSELLHIQWFNDPFVKAIRHLDTIIDIEKQQQPNFLKGLGSILFKFPENILKKRIFPKVLDLFQYPHLINSVLQICIDSLEKLDKVQYKQVIWPKLQKLTLSKEIPGQALYCIVENIEKFFEVVGKQEIQNSIMPLLLKCYDFPITKLQEMSLAKTEFVMKHWEYQSFTKPKIIPKIFNMLGNEKTTLAVKKQNLCLVKKILKSLDKQSINDILIPALDKLKKTQTDIEVRMSMLFIYQTIAKELDANILGNKLLPSLIPMLLDPNSKRNEYLEYSKTIHGFLKRIDEERLQELPQDQGDFDFDQIANKTQLNVQTQNKQNTQNNNSNSSNFDFLDTINSGLPTNTNTTNTINTNTNTTVTNNTISNNNNNVQNNVDDDDFFSDFNQQNNNNTNTNSNSNNQVQQNKTNTGFSVKPPPSGNSTQQVKNVIEPPKKNQTNNNKVTSDPFFDDFNSSQSQNTNSWQKQATTTVNTNNQNTNYQQQQQQQNKQQTEDPFFKEFNSNSNNTFQQSKPIQQQNSNLMDDPFADIQSSSNNNFNNNNNITTNNFNNNNNQNNMNMGNMGMNQNVQSNYDDPFADLEKDNPPQNTLNSNFNNQSQQQSQKQQQQQQKGNLFSKLQVKKPPQSKKQWNFNSGLGEDNNNQQGNINNNQQSQQNTNNNNNNNDFDDLF